MAEAADFSMPDVFANDYLNRTKIHDSHTLYSTESRKLSCVSFMSLKNLC